MKMTVNMIMDPDTIKSMNTRARIETSQVLAATRRPPKLMMIIQANLVESCRTLIIETYTPPPKRSARYAIKRALYILLTHRKSQMTPDHTAVEQIAKLLVEFKKSKRKKMMEKIKKKRILMYIDLQYKRNLYRFVKQKVVQLNRERKKKKLLAKQREVCYAQLRMSILSMSCISLPTTIMIDGEELIDDTDLPDDVIDANDDIGDNAEDDTDLSIIEDDD